MSRKERADEVAEAFAYAMRDAFRSWHREHHGEIEAEVAWALEVSRLEVVAHYTPQHTGIVAVEVVSKRPGDSELYPYSLAAIRDGMQLRRDRGEV